MVKSHFSKGGKKMSDELKDNLAGAEAMPSFSAAPVCPGGQLYTVKPGDSLFFIAKQFNIPLQSLINANPQITDPNTIFPGQVICIPVPGPGITCPGGQIYRVVRGDSLYEIARRFGVTLDALIRANPQISDPNLIYPGQEICVPVPGTAPCPSGNMYTVQPGDTMYEIARRNNLPLSVLIAANPQITDPNLIFPGQVICIPLPQAQLPEVSIPIAPLPAMPLPAPVPTPLPAPLPLPLPMPQPCPPSVMPRPCPPPVMPQPCPPQAMPFATGPSSMMYPMPVYIVIPWDECPHRQGRKGHNRHGKPCR